MGGLLHVCRRRATVGFSVEAGVDIPHPYEGSSVSAHRGVGGMGHPAPRSVYGEVDVVPRAMFPSNVEI